MKSWRTDTNAVYPRLYQWSSVIGGLDFSRSLFLVYFLSLGFSGAQTGLLQAILFWSSFAIELPSGIFADRFGRKKSLIIGFLLMIATFVTLASVSSFWAAAIGFSMWGMCFAFISGSGAALLYDGLKESGRLETHLDWLSRTRSLGTAAMAAAIFTGGFLYGVSPVLIFWATAVSASIGLILISFVPEPAFHEDHAEHGTIKGLRRFFADRKGRNLLIFLGGMAAIDMAQTPFFILSQGLLHEQGLSEIGVSMVLGGGFLLTAFAQRLAPRARRWPVLKMVLVICAVLIPCIGALWLRPGLAALLILFFVINVVPQMLFVHTDQYIQEHCESRIRASLLSVQSFVNAVLIGLSYFAIGALSDEIGMARALACLSLPVAIGALLVTWHFARAKAATA